MPSQRFLNRVIVITGGGTGIGLAAAHAFAREGARLVLTGRNIQRLQQAAAQFTTPVLPVACDVTHRPAVEALFTQTIAHFGRLDILVNNAGTAIIGPLESVQSADATALFETNFYGTFHCCQAVLPHFRRQGGGQIVNVSSLAGLRGVPNAIYSASKAAVIGFSEALRIEVQTAGISVTILCPGRVRASDTELFTTAKRYGTAELSKSPGELTAAEVARVLLNATHRRKQLVVFPFHAWLLHTINQLSPALADRILQNYIPKPCTP
ncbi:MAG: SDR family NAD(P)-dependent oxidoreductase [Verrucomicrobiota bacterium]